MTEQVNLKIRPETDELLRHLAATHFLPKNSIAHIAIALLYDELGIDIPDHLENEVTAQYLAAVAPEIRRIADRLGVGFYDFRERRWHGRD